MTDHNWKKLILRAAGIREHWYSQNDAEILGAMQTLLPNISQMENRVKAELDPILARDDKDAATLYKEMLMQIIGDNALDISRFPYSSSLERSDILRLFRNILADSIIRELYRKVSLQGLYENGVEFARNRSALFAGLPPFSYYHSLGLYKLAMQKGLH